MKAFGAACVLFILVVYLVRSGWTLPSFDPPAPVVVVQEVAPTPIEPTQMRVVDRQAVVQRMQSAAFLLTTRVEAAATVTLKREGQFFDLINGETVTVQTVGMVRSGVDLQTLDQAQVVVDGTRLAITLPAPQIESVTLDEDRTFVAGHDLTWFATSDPALADHARRLARDEIRRVVCEHDLATRTQRDAEQAITNLVVGLGATAVEVNVQPSTMCDH